MCWELLPRSHLWKPWIEADLWQSQWTEGFGVSRHLMTFIFSRTFRHGTGRRESHWQVRVIAVNQSRSVGHRSMGQQNRMGHMSHRSTPLTHAWPISVRLKLQLKKSSCVLVDLSFIIFARLCKHCFTVLYTHTFVRTKLIWLDWYDK